MTDQINIRTLKDHVSRILRGVREERREYVITYHGKPVAVLRPFTRADTPLLKPSRTEQELQTLADLGAQIAAAWSSEKTALELVEEGRR